MAGVIIPATGIGTLQPLISSDQVTADSSWVENVQLVTVAGGVMTRVSSTVGLPIVGVAGGTPIPITGTIAVTGTMPVTGSVLEDSASASGDAGLAILVVRQDTLATSTSTDGDYAFLKTNAAGALYVTGAGGGTQYTEDVASVGGESMTLAGTIRSDTPAGTTSTDGDYANLKTDSIGRLWTQVGASALPTGAATAAKQPALGTAGSPSADVITVQGNASGTPIPVTGSITISGTMPISAVSLPLPTGASTAAKQPALGTAGSAATDVITIQGIASGTVVPVSDGSGSLTVDAPQGTPVFVRLSDGTNPITTLPVSNASVPLPTGTATIGDGRQVVTTAGTAVQFSAQACKQATITALSTNTNLVVIGSSTVVAAAGTRRGLPLAAGDTAVLDVSNMNLVYIDSLVNGEGVSFLWEA